MIEFIDSLYASPHIVVEFIDQSTHFAAWALLKARANFAWSLVDASSFVLMQAQGIVQALTLDHHFEQAGFQRLPVQ
jgi:predicted nucleic acid-binding protein